MKDLKQEQEVKQCVAKLYELQQEKKKFDKYYSDVRKKEQLKVSNYMFTNLPNDETSFEIELDDGLAYYSNHIKLRVTKVRTKKVQWLLDKLKKKLDKDVYKSVVNKTYIVNDMQGLVKYLKTCGVNPKKFKKFIDVSEELNTVELDRLYDIGEIKKEQVAGCYDVTFGEPYIKLTELKHD